MLLNWRVSPEELQNSVNAQQSNRDRARATDAIPPVRCLYGSPTPLLIGNCNGG